MSPTIFTLIAEHSYGLIELNEAIILALVRS
jgi:hypothetical protein